MNRTRILIGVTLMVALPSCFAYAANSVITIHGTGDPSTSAHITVTTDAYLCPDAFIVENGASLSIWGRDAIGGITSGRGTVALVDKSDSADNRTFNYEVTWESGWIASCTYYGSNITGASVDGDAAANGWGVQTQTPTTVVFTTDTELTSGSLTGFHITGLDVAAPGSWECGSGSGSVDGPLPVELSSFTATAGDGQATLRWVTESEIDNLGFDIYRALEAEGVYQRLTAELIEGAGNTSAQQTYSFTDIRLTNGVTYWYKLEDVAFDGTSTMHGPIAVTPQAKEEVLAAVVKLSSFTAQAEDDGITLQWVAEGEIANLGFLVYRASEEDGVYERLTPEMLTGAGVKYAFTDSEVSQGGTYWYMLEYVTSDGTWTKHGPISVTVQAEEEIVAARPEVYALSPCYPNPFNPSTTIRYQLSEPGYVKLTIYDLLAQEVRVLVSERQPAGWYQVSWDGRDEVGQPVSSGVYLYRLEVGESFLETRKMVMVR